jgi:hypothetical protein
MSNVALMDFMLLIIAGTVPQSAISSSLGSSHAVISPWRTPAYKTDKNIF